MFLYAATMTMHKLSSSYRVILLNTVRWTTRWLFLSDNLSFLNEMNIYMIPEGVITCLNSYNQSQ